MRANAAFWGCNFVNDFLCESVVETPDGQTNDDAALGGPETGLRAIVDPVPFDRFPNESQTEDDLIWSALKRLGWTATLRQQNLSAAVGEGVPERLPLAHRAIGHRANRFGQHCHWHQPGLAVVETKRWQRGLSPVASVEAT